MRPFPHETLRAAFADEKLLGHTLAGDSWRAWRIMLIAAMGEALTENERTIFKQLTGRDHEPGQRVEEFVGVIGRRGGKTQAIGALSTYIAGLREHKGLARGERGVLLCVAADQRQADILLNYIDANFRASPVLRQLILRRTQRALRLKNNIDIEVRAADFRRLRGATYIAVVADELAFWMIDGANPDAEILTAVRPGLSTTRGQLFLISSPYARRGTLWETFEKHFGAAGDPLILVAHGSSTTFNPTLDQKTIDRAVQRDPASARAEWFGEFRSDLENFFTREALLACVDRGVLSRMPDPAFQHLAFVDAATGSGQDAIALSIVHVRDGITIPDICIQKKPPFSAAAVIAEWRGLLRAYRCPIVYGDNFGAGLVHELFRQHAGVNYISQNVPSKSSLYLTLLTLVNSGQCRLLDIQILLEQALSLERKLGRDGHDTVDHSYGAHDDLINAYAGAVVMALKRVAVDQPIVAPGIVGPDGEWSSAPKVLRNAPATEDGTARANAMRPPPHYLRDFQHAREPWRAFVGRASDYSISPRWRYDRWSPPRNW